MPWTFSGPGAVPRVVAVLRPPIAIVGVLFCLDAMGVGVVALVVCCAWGAKSFLTQGPLVVPFFASVPV
jgi:hypothetical protein